MPSTTFSCPGYPDAVATFSTSTAPLPPVAGPWGSLLFNDDATVPDLKLWNNNRDGDGLSYDVATIRSKRAFKRGGILVEQAAKVTATTPDRLVHDGKILRPGTRLATKAAARVWESAYLDTIGKFSYQYGLLEVVCQTPTTAGDSSGLWPAPVWIRPDAGESGDGEGDVIEAYGEPGSRTDYRAGSGSFSIHENEQATHKKLSGWLTPAGAPRLSAGMNSIALAWTPTYMETFFAGKSLGRFTVAANPWIATSFAGKFNLRSNFQVGNSYYGQPDAKTKPLAELLIQSVRVWGYQGA